MYGMLVALTWPIWSCSGARNDHQSNPHVAGNRFGGLKGIVAINNILATRVLDDRFDLMQSVYSNSNFSEIAGLLGGYEGVGIKNKFGNGNPNAVNMLLWSTVLKNFATQIADSVCVDGSRPDGFRDSYRDSDFVINKEAQAVFQGCGRPQGAKTWRENPRALWDLLIQTDAPEAEFQAWSMWVKSDEFEGFYQSPREQLSSGISAALLNPYFLLER
jgi:hypothetical protein